MRRRISVSAAILVGVVTAVWLLDLGLTSTASDARISTTLLRAAPAWIALVALAALAAGWVRTRSRRVRAMAARPDRDPP